MKPLVVVSALAAAALLVSGAAFAADGGPASVAQDFVPAVPAVPVTPPPAPVAAALDGITAEALGARVRFLASPALEGRGLGSRGLDAALEYAASSLALAGIPPLLDPAGADADAGAAAEAAPYPRYFQPVPLREITGAGGELAVETRRGDALTRRAFASGVDAILEPAPLGTITAPAVFAGHGIREPGLGHDDYKGLDVRGKIVVVRRGTPAGEAWKDAALRGRYDPGDADDRWDAKRETAEALGALALIGLEGDGFAARLAERDAVLTTWWLPADIASASIPVVRVSPLAAATLLGADSEAAPVAAPASAARPLPGVTVTLRTTGTERAVVSRNVIGVLAGADPARRDEAVVIGAHADHLGRSGETIYFGADDNASGTAALLEIARAFAALPERPARTVIFAFWTGEEEGKFGSGYWVRHPGWPLARTRAYLNLDMIGHPWLPEEIRKLVTDARLPDGEAFLTATPPADFAEPGLPADAPALAAALRWAGPATGMALHFDWTDGTRGGSDYRDFARARVPFVRFFGNFFPAYHEPGDTADALDPAQVRRLARLAFATAWHLAAR
ncbi:MAG: M20/M25/M40 family metallo-hydrolase [Acidobacteria bacterium]|nr:M20/M25/M40 family metallo-hydrolase [Acidobacteriota bacterium]